jgi:hypothetical protein
MSEKTRITQIQFAIGIDSKEHSISLEMWVYSGDDTPPAVLRGTPDEFTALSEQMRDVVHDAEETQAFLDFFSKEVGIEAPIAETFAQLYLRYRREREAPDEEDVERLRAMMLERFKGQPV